MSARSRALSLYRSFLRARRQLPSQNRRDFVATKARAEFEANKDERDADTIEQHIAYGEFMLETLDVQAGHLTELHEQGILGEDGNIVVNCGTDTGPTHDDSDTVNQQK